MSGTYTLALGLGAFALLCVRAVCAALEAALVAVGLPRAQELGAASDATPRARALSRLFDEPEITAFALRATVTLASVFAGFLGGVLGVLAFPERALAA